MKFCIYTKFPEKQATIKIHLHFSAHYRRDGVDFFVHPDVSDTGQWSKRGENPFTAQPLRMLLFENRKKH